MLKHGKNTVLKTKKQAKLNTEFTEVLKNKYSAYCIRESKAESLEGFTRYLMECGLVDQALVNKYMTVYYYPKAMYNNNGNKRNAVYNLEELTPYCERTIYYILKNQKQFNTLLDPPPFLDSSL
jgi:hypothetical protein